MSELKPRRLSLTQEIVWRHGAWLLTVGFDEQGRAREIFLDGVPVDAGVQGWVSERCIALSKEMQDGRAAELLAGELADHTHPTAPLLCLALRAAALLETQHGADLAKFHALSRRARAWLTPITDEGSGP